MPEFFRGRRRKIGVATHLVTLLLAGLWVRSLSVGDFLVTSSDQFLSSRGSLFWEHSSVRQPSTSRSLFPKLSYASGNLNHITDTYVDPGWNDNRRWRYMGFAYGRVTTSSAVFPTYISSYRIVPYWSIVIPLTILSAYLLLTRPRHHNSENAATISETTN